MTFVVPSDHPIYGITKITFGKVVTRGRAATANAYADSCDSSFTYGSCSKREPPSRKLRSVDAKQRAAATHCFDSCETCWRINFRNTPRRYNERSRRPIQVLRFRGVKMKSKGKSKQIRPLRIAGYVRVSSQRQVNEGDSLTAQQNEIEQEVEFRTRR